MSARISGVKNFESKAASFVRGLPFSQVQSQSEKGSILVFFAGASAEVLGTAATAGCTEEALGLGLAKFAAVTEGTFGPTPVDTSPRLEIGAAFCCSTSARRRSTSARSALNSSRISCCSVGAELEPVFAEDIAAPWVD